MAALTLQNITDNVRSHLDVDSEELPDNLVKFYAQEGYDRIVRAELRWPHLFFSGEGAVTTADVQYVSLNHISDPRHIIGPSWPLEYMDFDRLVDQFYVNNTTTGEPTHWTYDQTGSSGTGLRIYFGPVPAQSYSHTVYGWREPSDWIAMGAGGTPDGPEEFGRLVQTWVLSCAYLQVGDYELAQMYEARFDKGLQELHARFTQAVPVPVVLNADTTRYGTSLPPRLRFPWE